MERIKEEYSLNNEIIKESKKLADEKTAFADECTVVDFQYRGVQLLVRKNDLVKEAV